MLNKKILNTLKNKINNKKFKIETNLGQFTINHTKNHQLKKFLKNFPLYDRFIPHLAEQNKKKIIAWGVAGAFVFRIFFAFGTDYMLEYAWIKILGGLLLIWIVNNIRQDLFGKNKICDSWKPESLRFSRFKAKTCFEL